MTSLFLEPFSGISGDMLNGLLLDLGADFHHLETRLKQLGIEGYHLHAHRLSKSAIWGTDFDVHLSHGKKDQGIHGDFEIGRAHV